jgi:hypothetical protein
MFYKVNDITKNNKGIESPGVPGLCGPLRFYKSQKEGKRHFQGISPSNCLFASLTNGLTPQTTALSPKTPAIKLLF